MLTPRRESQGMDVLKEYQYYQKWHQKRIEVKEKVNEKLNDSFGALTARPGLEKPSSKQERVAAATPLGHTRKATQFKQQLLDMAGHYTARATTPMGQYRLSNNAEESTKGEPAAEKGRGRFDELLNAYFSSLPTKITSPSKEGTVKKRNEFKDIMNNLKGSATVSSPMVREPKPATTTPLTKSPILKFKEQYDTIKRKNVDNVSPLTSHGTPFAKNSAPPKPRGHPAPVVSRHPMSTRSGVMIRYLNKKEYGVDSKMELSGCRKKNCDWYRAIWNRSV